MSRFWTVSADKKDGYVNIVPPDHIDTEYDDVRLEVTGNMLFEQKLEIGRLVAGKLNTPVQPRHPVDPTAR